MKWGWPMNNRTQEDADELAIEHCLWAASEGLQPVEIISSIGCVPPAMYRATWHDAQHVLTNAWHALHQDPTPPRPKTSERKVEPRWK